MQFQLAIRCFQSIDKADLVFRNGVTVITGPSCSGKTAVFRAIKAAVCNPRYGKSYIKSGKDAALVAMRVDDGEAVTWSRTKAASAYKVGKVVNTKTGNTCLAQVYPEFPLLWDENDDRLVNLHSENDLLFPFEKKAADLFKLFEDIFQVSDSSEIIRVLKKDTDQEKERLVKLNIQSELMSRKLNACQRFSGEVELSQLKLFRNRIASLDEEMEALETSHQRAYWLNEEMKVQLPKPREFDFSMIEASQTLSKDFQDVVLSSMWLSRARGLEEKQFNFKSIQEFDTVYNDAIKAHQLNLFVEGHKKIKSKSFDFSKIVSFRDLNTSLQQTEPLIRYLQVPIDTKERSFDFGTIKRFSLLSEDLKDVTRLQKVEEVGKRIEDEGAVKLLSKAISGMKEKRNAQLILGNSYNDVTKISSEIEKLDSGQKESEAELTKIKERLNDFDVCPLCGSNLTKV